MDEHASTPDGVWLAAWFLANAPWIYAGCASAAVRFVYRWGVEGGEIRPSVSEAFICFCTVSVLSPVASRVGLDNAASMVVGVGVGLVGPDVVRSALIQRLHSAAKAFLKGK